MPDAHPYFAAKAALIFGGGKGIGSAVAIELARRGCHIVIADLDEVAARETAARIAEKGGQAAACACNVLDQQSVEAAVQFARDSMGLPDIVINNVGAMLNGHPEDIPMSEWQRMMDLNYFSAVRVMQIFLPEFIARGRGHIVNTASFAGLYPYAVSRMPYAAAKAALIALTQSMALYLEPQGVRVSCFIPGPVATGIMDSMTSWTPDCPVRGPGANLSILSADEAAHVLADGMSAGQMMIASDTEVWPIVQNWAHLPDQFLREKIAAFERGESGRPVMPKT